MQRYILRRFLHSLGHLGAEHDRVQPGPRHRQPAGRVASLEAGPEEYERVAKHWGSTSLSTRSTSFLWAKPCAATSAPPEVAGAHRNGPGVRPLARHAALAGLALLISIVIAVPIGVMAAVMKDTPSIRCRSSSPCSVIALLLARHRPDVGVRRATRGCRPRAGAGSAT